MYQIYLIVLYITRKFVKGDYFNHHLERHGRGVSTNAGSRGDPSSAFLLSPSLRPVLLLLVPFILIPLPPLPTHGPTLRVAVFSVMARDLAISAIGLTGDRRAATPVLGFVGSGRLESDGGGELAGTCSILVSDALLDFS